MPIQENDDGIPVVPDNLDVEDLLEQSSSAVDNIFGIGGSDEPAEEPAPTEEPKPAEEDPKPAEEDPKPAEEPEPTEDPKPAEEPEPSGEDEEYDFDADLDNKPPEQDQPDPEGEESKPHVLREQLSEVGKKLKIAETAKIETELELVNVREENDNLKKQLDSMRARSEDYSNHPEVKSITDGIIQDRDAFALRLNEKATHFKDALPDLMTRFMSIQESPEEDRAGKFAILKKELFNQYGDKDEYTDYEEVGIPSSDPTVDKILDFLGQQSPALKRAQDKHSELSDKAKAKTLAANSDEYASKSQVVASSLESIEDIPEEKIESDPFNMASIVAKLVKDNPEVDICRAPAGALQISTWRRWRLNCSTETETPWLSSRRRELKRRRSTWRRWRLNCSTVS